MPSSFTSFSYDPSRDGYDLDTWKTVYGSPYVSGGVMTLTEAGTIHRGDCKRGYYSMNLKMPSTPAGGESRRWGLYSVGSGAYLWFAMDSEMLYAQASDGFGNTSETEIEWADGVIETWGTTDTWYKIRWEAGQAHFYVNNTRRATLSGASIPNGPLALYASNVNNDGMSIKFIDADGIQIFFMHTDNADTDAGDGPVLASQVVSIAENVATQVT